MNGRDGFGGLAAALLLALVLAGAVPAAAATPPDRVDPPAPGEGRPLADPTEPDEPGFTAAAAPRASFQPGVRTTWRRPTVQDAVGTDRFSMAIAASRAGWPSTSTVAVVTRGDRWPGNAAAGALAGNLRVPLLYTSNDLLHRGTRDELRRLRVRQVYAVGVSQPIRDQLAAAGFTVEGWNFGDPANLAFRTVQLAMERGVVFDTSAVVVTAAGPGDALPAINLAGGKRYPLLLLGEGGRAELTRQVNVLRAGTVYVVGGPAAVPSSAVQGLAVTRLAGSNGAETAVAVARQARRLGMGGIKASLTSRDLGEAAVAGALAATRRAPAVVGDPKQLPSATMDWLSSDRPRWVTMVRTSQSIGPLARCQLRSGAARPFRCVEAELERQGYNVGKVDGSIDRQTVWSFYAFKKVAGLKVNGTFGEAEWRAMVTRPTIKPRRTNLGSRHMEIDLSRQLVLLFDRGRLAHAFHTSTGKRSTPTVRGTFTVYEKRNYRQANRMYRSIFFYRGYAVHGYPEIPLYPASAGCARTFDGDQDFLWPKVPRGMRVAVY